MEARKFVLPLLALTIGIGIAVAGFRNRRKPAGAIALECGACVAASGAVLLLARIF